MMDRIILVSSIYIYIHIDIHVCTIMEEGNRFLSKRMLDLTALITLHITGENRKELI
jgi:hypothetical protein